MKVLTYQEGVSLCANVWFTDVQISGSLSVSGVVRVV